MLVKSFDAHLADASLYHLADPIVHHGRRDTGLETKAIRQIRSHVIFATGYVDIETASLAKGNDPWIEPMNEST